MKPVHVTVARKQPVHIHLSQNRGVAKKASALPSGHFSFCHHDQPHTMAQGRSVRTHVVDENVVPAQFAAALAQARHCQRRGDALVDALNTCRCDRGLCRCRVWLLRRCCCLD